MNAGATATTRILASVEDRGREERRRGRLLHDACGVLDAKKTLLRFVAMTCDPFPAEIIVRTPTRPTLVEGFTHDEHGLVIRPKTLLEAVASLEGRWISPTSARGRGPRSLGDEDGGDGRATRQRQAPSRAGRRIQRGAGRPHGAAQAGGPLPGALPDEVVAGSEQRAGDPTAESPARCPLSATT